MESKKISESVTKVQIKVFLSLRHTMKKHTELSYFFFFLKKCSFCCNLICIYSEKNLSLHSKSTCKMAEENAFSKFYFKGFRTSTKKNFLCMNIKTNYRYLKKLFCCIVIVPLFLSLLPSYFVLLNTNYINKKNKM